jgi:hypothetical protein
MMDGNLVNAPEPNSMRGKREMEKSEMRTGGFQIEKERLNGSDFAGSLPAYKLGRNPGFTASP